MSENLIELSFGSFKPKKDDSNKLVEYACCLIIFGLIAYVIYDNYYADKTEGFKTNPETARVPKLSPEQQSAQLEQTVMNEYDDLNRSLMGGAISQRDQHFLVDADKGVDKYLVHNMKCSKSCCGNGGWPIPHDIRRDPGTCKLGSKEYIPTNMTCSNEYTTGCACVDKDQWKFLASHGRNNSWNNPYRNLLS